MGLNSSFITSYCTQLKFQLTEENLLSLGYQKLEAHSLGALTNRNNQIYQHYQTKKLYSLTTITSSHHQAALLAHALQTLQSIKNYHLSNVLFSSVNSNSIISTVTSIKIFTEHSPFTLDHLIDLKNIQKPNNYPSQNLSSNLPYSNFQITNFVKNISGILSQIQNLSLPIHQIQPSQFLVILSQSGKIKYQIDFQHFLTINSNTIHNSYFSPQFFEQSNSTQAYIKFTQTQWKQRYQKNLIFSFGIIILHYLLLEPLYDCYNLKTKQFCQSQFQNKLNKLCQILETRHQQKQKLKSTVKQNSATEMSQTYMERLNTDSKIDSQEPFELILYETILRMLAIDKNQRIGIQQFKITSNKLIEKVSQEYTMTKCNQTFITSTSIEKAHQIAPIIKSINNQSNTQSFDDIKIEKKLSENEANTAHSFLQKSQSRSMITHLRTKQVSDRQKLLNDSHENQNMLTKRKTIRNQQLDKENLHNNKDMQKSDIKSLKGSIRKLSGYRKMKISDSSYIEGFFQNDKAHGLGKITRRNGQTIQCIFHNNEIIESISGSPKH